MTDRETSAAERSRAASAALAAIAVHQGGNPDEPWRITVEAAERMDGWQGVGRLVRQIWVEWAREQTDPKPSWLLPWEELDDGQREVDMRIGAALFRAGAEAAAPLVAVGPADADPIEPEHLRDTIRDVLSSYIGDPVTRDEIATGIFECFPDLFSSGSVTTRETSARPVVWPSGAVMAVECTCTIRHAVFLASPDCVHHGVPQSDELTTARADRDAYRLLQEHAYADRDRLAAELAELRGRLSVWATRVRMLAAHSVSSPSAKAGAGQMADDMDAAAREGTETPGDPVPEATGHDELTPSVETHGPTLRSSRRDR